MKNLIFTVFILSIMSCSAQKNTATAVKDPSGNLFSLSSMKGKVKSAKMPPALAEAVKNTKDVAVKRTKPLL